MNWGFCLLSTIFFARFILHVRRDKTLMDVFSSILVLLGHEALLGWTMHWKL